MFSIIPQLLKYLPVVLFIAVLSFALAVLTGLLFAAIIHRRVPVAYPVVWVLVSFFRGVPSLVQISSCSSACRNWYRRLAR